MKCHCIGQLQCLALEVNWNEKGAEQAWLCVATAWLGTASPLPCSLPNKQVQ